MRKAIVLFVVGGLALPTCALSEDNPDHACATIAMHVISGLKGRGVTVTVHLIALSSTSAAYLIKCTVTVIRNSVIRRPSAPR
jgi:hypothetical protein